MRRNVSRQAAKRVAIVHGWAEDDRLSRRLANNLKSRGFEIADDPTTADIVFAHSLGCYLLPKDFKADLVMLVGIPHGPIHYMPVALIRKLAREIAYHRSRGELTWWLKKAVYGLWCATTQPQKTYSVFTKRNTHNLPASEGRKVVVIRPTDDPFVQENIDELLKHKGYEHAEVDGMHDSCWLQPDVYADVLEQASKGK